MNLSAIICLFLNMLSNSYQASRNSGLSALKSHVRHLVILRGNPKPASRTEIDARSCRAGSGEIYSEMVMVNMVFCGFGTCRTWMAWSGCRA